MIGERDIWFSQSKDMAYYTSEIFLIKIPSCFMSTEEKKQFPPGLQVRSLKKIMIDKPPFPVFDIACRSSICTHFLWHLAKSSKYFCEKIRG